MQPAQGSEATMLQTIMPADVDVVRGLSRVVDLDTPWRAVNSHLDAPLEQPLRNRLLEALPVDEFEHVRPHLESVRFEQRDVLYEPDEPIQHVYFPETTV